MPTQRKGSVQGIQRPQVHVVTGGGGFPGFSLGKKLAEKGHQVRLFDIKEPAWKLHEGMNFIQGDIRNYEDVCSLIEGADVVYHMASYGMSGREQLNKKLIEEVNIGGTENVLRACLQCNVTRLVYTSTYNVVFCGQEIRDGDESLPYVTDDKFVDHYSKTKTQADKRILAADGTLTTNGSVLRCCVLRLAGVYGPGEQRHFPRIVSYLEQGLVQFTYGARDALADFLHIDNLVLGHMLAASGLTQEKEFIAAGQAYFLSDSKPVNSFEFFRPLIEGLGYKYPRINLPLGLIFYFALLTEMVHWLVRRFYNFQPILTRAEVYKTGVTHYFSTQKAKRELGYVPIVQNDFRKVVEYFIQTGHKKKKSGSSPLKHFIINLIIGFIFAAFIMSYLPLVR
ncbi:LOW QUALITY PROTEIN: short-chain dehydrogenase/reductase family 42E member 1-like [Pomacea canaliculata]|uniref:LOW QUALITY PROTEIN: short-chain dehydrogenase/reductase family 42E member 1-like n=1 Tax=Pomacea canaliculata TaxID=400727 RepID=UPI000D73738F|nr:LOW QUALITY PROTEIN: short-chain dehydrogenase/reductase family 42E member 1-like [Pomacea canaliculata]